MSKHFRVSALALLPLSVFGNLLFTNSTSVEYDRKKNLVSFVGNVEVRYREFVLQADRVSYNTKKQIITAEGNVFLTNYKDIYLHAKRAEYNLKNNHLKLFSVWGQLKEGFFKAKYFETDGKVFLFKKVCGSKCENYEAQVCARDFLYNATDGKGVLHSAILKLEDHPVFYTPYYSFLSKRKSGFLTPTFGFDSYREFIYQQPYYWVIDKHSDMTITADYRSGNMEGLGVEFRKYFSYKTYFETANWYYYDDAYPGKWWKGRSYHKRNRYLLSGSGYIGKLKFGWEYPSDKDFYYDIFFNEEEKHYKSFAKSYIDYQVENKDLILDIRGDYFYNLNTQNRSEDLARLPDIYFYLKPVELRKGIYLDLTSELTDFYRYNKSLWRFRLEPKFKLRKVFGKTPITLYFKPYYVYYSSRRYGNDRNVYGYKLKATGLLYSFDLIRSEDWTLFSTWEWTYTFHPFEEEKTPNFDTFDTFVKENQITLRSLNDLSYKGSQIAEVMFEQPYNFYNGYSLPTDGTPMNGHLLPFKVYYTLNTPEEDIKFNGKLYYDHQLSKIIYHSTGIRWTAIKTLLSSLTLSASYSKGTGYGGETTSEQYSFGAKLKYHHLETSFKNYYDALLEKNTRTSAQIAYAKKCWKLGFYYEREYDKDSGNYRWRVMLLFSLFDNPLRIPIYGGENG